MIVDPNRDPIEQRNAKLLIPPKGELLAGDGRVFKIKSWRPCMEVGSVFTVEVVMLDAEDCGGLKSIEEVEKALDKRFSQ